MRIENLNYKISLQVVEPILAQAPFQVRYDPQRGHRLCHEEQFSQHARVHEEVQPAHREGGNHGRQDWQAR